jgi:hypothetical protein
MGTKVHHGEMKNASTVFHVAETARTEVANFPRSANPSLPIYLQHGVQYLHQVSARLLYRFVHVPYVAWPNPQTIKHFVQIAKKENH